MVLQLNLALVDQVQQISDDMMLQFLTLISQQQVGNRSGRVEPRALKRRQKLYLLLSKPRGLARQGIIENGHAKKLK